MHVDCCRQMGCVNHKPEKPDGPGSSNGTGNQNSQPVAGTSTVSPNDIALVNKPPPPPVPVKKRKW